MEKNLTLPRGAEHTQWPATIPRIHNPEKKVGMCTRVQVLEFSSSSTYNSKKLEKKTSLHNGIYIAVKMNELQLHAKWMNLKNCVEEKDKSQRINTV